MESESSIWQSRVELDGLTGDLYITFPDEMMEKLNWNEGTILTWNVIDNNIAIITKKNG